LWERFQTSNIGLKVWFITTDLASAGSFCAQTGLAPGSAALSVREMPIARLLSVQKDLAKAELRERDSDWLVHSTRRATPKETSMNQDKNQQHQGGQHQGGQQGGKDDQRQGGQQGGQHTPGQQNQDPNRRDQPGQQGGAQQGGQRK
jgi:general stress protein YciG